MATLSQNVECHRNELISMGSEKDSHRFNSVCMSLSAFLFVINENRDNYMFVWRFHTVTMAGVINDGMKTLVRWDLQKVQKHWCEL